MYVIVSNKLKSSFVQFKIVNSFKEACEDPNIKNVDVLVFHETSDNDLNAGVWLSKFKEKYPEALLLYICKNPRKTILMALRGARGTYYEDEFYLHDEEELISLIDEYKSGNIETENELAVVHSSLDIVNDFMSAFLNNDKRVNMSGYQSQVQDAITNLTVYTKEQEQQIQVMGDSALSIFSQAAVVIQKLKKATSDMQLKLEEFENSGRGGGSALDAGFSNMPTSFSTYRFVGGAKILCLREWAPTRYLTSFAMAYRRYLYLNYHKRAKVVFIYQRSNGIARKYEKMTTITPEVVNRDNLYLDDVIATNNPKKEVMDKLLKQPNLDVVILVDRLYGKECIIQGRVKEISVVSSRTDFERYKVAPDTTITSVMEYPNCFFCIPTLDKFPTDEDTRYAVYFSQFKDVFDKLNKIIGIGV